MVQGTEGEPIPVIVRSRFTHTTEVCCVQELADMNVADGTRTPIPAKDTHCKTLLTDPTLIEDPPLFPVRRQEERFIVG